METEAALCGSTSSFVLEKVLQEVKEVENREHHEDEAETSQDDLKFRPGFVHLLKDRFTLLSVQTNSRETPCEGPIKSSTSVIELADSNSSRTLGISTHLSKSNEQLDTRTHRHRGSLPTNTSGSPEKLSDRLNGSIPSPLLSSTTYIRHQSKQDITDSPTDTSKVKGQPSSIHLFPNPPDSKTLNRIRSAGNKVIIIETAVKKQSKDEKKPSLQKQGPSLETAVSNEDETNEAWPTPNIVKSTRSLFEKRRNKRPAPSAPTNSNASLNTQSSPLSPKSFSPNANDNDKVPSIPTTPTQILVHGQPLKVHQTQSQKSPLLDKSNKQFVNEKSMPKESQTPKKPDSNGNLRRSSGPLSTSSILPASKIDNLRNNVSVDETSGPEQETVVSVSEAKMLFDKITDSRVNIKDGRPDRSKPPSPKRNKALVFPASNKSEPSQLKSPTRRVATTQFSSDLKSNNIRKNQASDHVPVSSLGNRSTLPSSSTIKGSQLSSPASVKPSAHKNDPNSWQTWDDIPKPKRKTFVSEARRVEIPKEQLTASRAKTKSFFFTVADSTATLDDEPTNDRTITISIPKADDHNKVNETVNTSSGPAPSESRLAQQTFWDSYRNDEEAKGSNIDSELYGEYLKLMASTKSPSDAGMGNEKVTDDLPATNIDDLLNGDRSQPIKKGIRVLTKGAKREKAKISFASESSLIATYEYPSERTMIEELGISPDFDLDGGAELSIDDPAALFGLDDVDDDDETLNAAKLLSGKPAVTSGTLASYKSKYGASDYAWGQDKESESSGSATRDLLDGGGPVAVDSEAADEASVDEDGMNWSSAATSDLLF